MNYTMRGPDSDVHVYYDGVSWRCLDCSLVTTRDFCCGTARAMVRHLSAHRVQGERVPVTCFARLFVDVEYGGLEPCPAEAEADMMCRLVGKIARAAGITPEDIDGE